MRRRVRPARVTSAIAAPIVGVQLTPVARQADNAGGRGAITGPIVLGGDPGGGYACTWLVFMRGVIASDVLQWYAEWDGMAGDFAGAVFFTVPDEIASQPMVAQILAASTASLPWIDVYAIVNDTRYGPVRVSCNY